MIETVNKTFQIHEENVDNFLKELDKWNIEKETNTVGFEIKIQAYNTLYTIQMNIIEKFPLEEELFMFNLYPIVKTFEDVQLKIFDKIIWNWK